ncbi:MAG: NAD(P)-binding domain-containing protein [Candidatus Eisenbacteria bacterium]|nr:NAD(P)-binding domain-containing protein [Candidatus Eisenbacteria bacterium]
MSFVGRYTHWLHTRWPAGGVEPLPEVGEDGATSVSGLRIVGDLSGVPLLKFSLDTGTRAVVAFVEVEGLTPGAQHAGVVDIAIVGAGVSGIAAAVEAGRRGLSYQVYESAEPFSTVVNFPKGKPIYTYPTEMTPAGQLSVSADVKESLLEELEEQRSRFGVEVTSARVESVRKDGDSFEIRLGDGTAQRARKVILAIGRTGNYRKLQVPGESLDKVSNRMYDPSDSSGRDVLVVGGGDSALESAIALAGAGARVTLSYRKPSFSRPKPENVEHLEELRDRVRLMLPSEVKEIRERTVVLSTSEGDTEEIPNDQVFTMIGREAPLDFLRRSGVRVIGEMSPRRWAMLGLFTALVFYVYLWKGWLIGHTDVFAIGRDWGLGPESLLGAFTKATAAPSFWFTSLYTACIVFFGIARIRRRPTPYVRRQTVALMAIQVVPLFILPEIVLPWMGANGWIPDVIQQNLFPNGEYWRALGFVLAWPLFLVNLASPHPMLWWIVIGLVQTFVIIPLLVWRWGKGAYCGWICSCGALAETMGDTHRHKMWHGPVANRWNMLGQVVLVLSVLVTLLFVASWHPSLAPTLTPLTKSVLSNYKFVVDIVIGGAIGVGFYFWFSGRVWCRFACPLAALMHVYARFSRFRIFAEKKKCISCNVCTTVCHQGIDVMSFANKGLPMEDPECVRCSACVQSCPTGVLRFGHLASDGTPRYDSLPASAVQMRETAGAQPIEV